ncbi:hypothetical protein SEA_REDWATTLEHOG_165 [Gordonia phage RedWattleHog]|nr:hypothetical protein SEA_REDWATTLEHOG_165 [Gordonia phage RedWattleHog]
MGATTFFHWEGGRSPEEAFTAARDQAKYDFGHAGYTGTIAEKSGFVMIPWTGEGLPDRSEAEDLGDKLIEDCDPRIDDKWGPAGCIKAQDGMFLFFGWASE